MTLKCTHYHRTTGMYYHFEGETGRYYFYTKGSWFFKTRKKYSGMKQGFVKL